MNTYTIQGGPDMDEFDIVVIAENQNRAKEIAAKVAKVSVDKLLQKIGRWAKGSAFHQIMSRSEEEGFIVINYKVLELDALDNDDVKAVDKYLAKKHMFFQRYNRRDEKIENFFNANENDVTV